MPRRSVGSGFIVDADKGYVLTNHHVIDGADEIVVTLQDRRRVEARLVGSDEGTDIALLKIDADDLHEIPLGDSETVRVGDFVVAIDGKKIINSSELRNRIGLTPVGEDIEVTDLRDGRRRTFEVEISTAGQLSLAGGDTFARLRGAEFRNLDPGHPRYDDARGPAVASVEQGSPAWRNGIREGDIVLAVNRIRVRNVDELSAALERSGSTIALNVLRGNSRIFIVVQ